MSIHYRDIWHWPIVLTSSNNVIRFQEGIGTVHTVTIPVGTYYTYRDDTVPASFATAYPSLYDAIEDGINAMATGTYELQAATPYLSSDATYHGLRIVRTADGGSPQRWGWFASDASFTLDTRYLGISPGEAATVDSDVTEIRSDFTRWGCWISPRHAARKLGDTTHIQYRNNGVMGARQTVRWRTDSYREMVYHRIPAGHVRAYRNDDAQAAQTAGLAQYDHGNYWHDLWLYGLSSDLDILLVHDIDTLHGSLDWGLTSHSWEIVRGRTDQQAASAAEVISDPNPRGEFYDLSASLTRHTKASVEATHATTFSTYYRRD